jgi:hypothetical protein
MGIQVLAHSIRRAKENGTATTESPTITAMIKGAGKAEEGEVHYAGGFAEELTAFSHERCVRLAEWLK